MTQQLDHASYQTWIEQFMSPGTKIYEIRDNVRCHVSTSYTPEEKAADQQAILQIMMSHAEKNEYRNLSMLAEYLRADGHYYWNTTSAMRKSLRLLLEQAIASIDSGEVFRDPYVLCLANSVYDLIFHQISFGRYEVICETLYNQLTARIEDEKFVQLWREAEANFVGDFFPDGLYEQCVYFINFDKDDDDEEEEKPVEDETAAIRFGLFAFENGGEQFVSTADILRRLKSIRLKS